jgi:hypothetical protein
MVDSRHSHNTIGKTRQYGSRWLLALVFFALLLSTCHRLPSPVEEDPRLPAPYSSPEKTFSTWVRATLSGDESAVRDCYWPGLPKEELSAWMRENLRPQARRMFQDAMLKEVRPATLVEVNFTFTVLEGSEEIRGVMVLTKQGWKLQSW